MTGTVTVAEAVPEKGDLADTLRKRDITAGCLGVKSKSGETQVRMEM